MNDYALTVKGTLGIANIIVWCMTQEESAAFHRRPMDNGYYMSDQRLDQVIKYIPGVLVYRPKYWPKGTMITYVLQVSNEKPTRFRISVLDRGVVPQVPYDAGYKSIGVFNTPEEVMITLVPYLKMEEGG